MPQLETHLASREVERNPAKSLQYVRSKQQGRPVGKAEHLERRDIGESDRHITQGHRTKLKLGDFRDLQIDGLPSDAGCSNGCELVTSAKQFVAKGEIANRDFGPGVDDGVEPQAGGADLGEDQL